MNKVGYALIAIGVVALIVWGAVEFLADPEVDPIIKVAVAVVCTGIAVLLAKVTRDRIKASKNDKFKGVER
jgi:hypothetical protein